MSVNPKKRFMRALLASVTENFNCFFFAFLFLFVYRCRGSGFAGRITLNDIKKHQGDAQTMRTIYSCSNKTTKININPIKAAPSTVVRSLYTPNPNHRNPNLLTLII